MSASLTGRMVGRAVRFKSVWMPVALGTLLVLAAGGSGAVIATGGVLIAMGMGRALWMLTVGSMSLRQDTLHDVLADQREKHHARLRELQRKLRLDRDPQTGQMLRQLRDMFDRLQKLILAASAKPPWRQETDEQLQLLYDSALQSLERSLDLFALAQTVSSDDARSELTEQRASLLKEVQASIEHLGRSLDWIQLSAVKSELPTDELVRLREELDQGLQVARNVQQRVLELEAEIGGMERRTHF